MPNYSHSSLCELMASWLKRPNSRGGPGCQIAVVEPRSGYNGESPDAIGWRRSGNPLDGCYVVECKISRSDFLADKNKPHRDGTVSPLGNVRFYACPAGLIEADELPSQWGLLWVHPRNRVEPVVSPFKTTNMTTRRDQADLMWQRSELERERFILLGLLSRVGEPEKFDRLLRQVKTDLSRSEREKGKLCEEAELLRAELMSRSLMLSELRARAPELYEEITSRVGQDRHRPIPKKR